LKQDKISSDDVACAIINLSENTGICDKDTAAGFRTSKRKDILKSTDEHSFSKFTKEMKKRQAKKDLEDSNNDD